MSSNLGNPPTNNGQPDKSNARNTAIILAIISLIGIIVTAVATPIGQITVAWIQHLPATIPTTPTSTPTPGPSPTSTPTPQNPYTKVRSQWLFTDALTEPDDRWQNNSDVGDGGACQFAHGEDLMVAQVKTQRFQFCTDSQDTFDNFTIEVHMVIGKGDCGGIIIRYDPSSGKGYGIFLCQSGDYGVYRYDRYSRQILTKLASGLSTRIAGLQQQNTVAVVANQNEFTLYVNSYFITDAFDLNNTYYNQGSIALVAEALSLPTGVGYTNATVWRTQP